jgi:hypothetical protein
MQLTVGELKQQLPGRLKVKTHNMRTKLGQAQAEMYGVMYSPTLLMLDQHGTIQKRIVGLVSAEQLRQELEAIIAR